MNEQKLTLLRTRTAALAQYYQLRKRLDQVERDIEGIDLALQAFPAPAAPAEPAATPNVDQ